MKFLFGTVTQYFPKQDYATFCCSDSEEDSEEFGFRASQIRRAERRQVVPGTLIAYKTDGPEIRIVSPNMMRGLQTGEEMCGEITAWNVGKGFGFCRALDADPPGNIFVHITAVTRRLPLKPGDIVSFHITETQDSFLAINVNVVADEKVEDQCSTT